ncbi:hypothetical protein H8959_014423 [Pygathrix nigripes]
MLILSVKEDIKKVLKLLGALQVSASHWRVSEVQAHSKDIWTDLLHVPQEVQLIIQAITQIILPQTVFLAQAT